MDENRPYVKRINLGIDTRNPDYKRAYDYIMEHKGGKFRFICDCILQVMEGRTVTEPQDINKSEQADLLSQLSSNPELIQSLAQAVARIMPNAQPQMEVIEEKVQETVVEPIEFEPLPAHPDEEKTEVSNYDGPMLDLDMLAGISAWDDMLE